MINPMSPHLRHALENLGYILTWLVLAIFATLTGFQIHATLIACAVFAVNSPTFRPVGWTTQTIYNLSSLLWVGLGIVWLVWVMYTQEYLSEGKQLQRLKKRGLRVFLSVGVTYLTFSAVLLLL